MKRLLEILREIWVAPIRFYQRFISPWTPPSCRFKPTCSAYGVEAVRTHGIVRGTFLTVWRVLRCQPFSEGGWDPVPPRRCAHEDEHGAE